MTIYYVFHYTNNLLLIHLPLIFIISHLSMHYSCPKIIDYVGRPFSGHYFHLRIWVQLTTHSQDTSFKNLDINPTISPLIGHQSYNKTLVQPSAHLQGTNTNQDTSSNIIQTLHINTKI